MVRILLYVGACFLFLFSEHSMGWAESNSEMYELYTAGSPRSSSARLRYAPLALPGGSQLTVISPEQWSPLADKLSGQLAHLHDYFSELFGPLPPFTTSIRLMDAQRFYQETGAPEWTNAMYYREQIIIPLVANEPVDLKNLNRSLRHEYAHAVVHALSDGRCPGWLDEGIAQWAEGKENPALRPALLNWLEVRNPVPLSLLQGGFTKLESDMVPAAYAQSLFAANTLITTYGFSKIREYFKALSAEKTKSKAFHWNFRLTEAHFESRLAEIMQQWAHEHREPKYR
ncbi:MAG: hypothetical protein KDD55_11490 [Bdellovibrionales bacterium]|nr:hypothetical protein [Bdellovibrionales bacterium]